MTSTTWWLAGAAAFALSTTATAHAQDEDADATKEAEFQRDLETLFPEKSFFGPGVRSTDFSADGKYAAYLWRPYLERRHGNDLWLLDVATGETKRLTSVSTMSRFQSDTREVRDDRIEKAKKADGDADDATSDETSDDAKKTTRPNGDHVDEKDADDEDAPRYGGVSNFVWAPEKAELLFTSGSDVYRYRAADGSIDRLTRSDEGESFVQWLPDGEGFCFRRGGGIVCVRFGSHLIELIEPDLPDGQNLNSFRLSPDGKKLALVSSTGSAFDMSARTVNIASYRNRFMEVRKAPRTVSDDPRSAAKVHLHLYDVGNPFNEEGKLHTLHTHDYTGPRDMVATPEWAPDSSRVAFATYRQDTDQIELFESVIEPPKAEETTEGEADETATAEDEEEKEDHSEPARFTVRTRVVDRILHDGGPNTPGMVQPVYLADSRHLLHVSEQSGFRHLHVLNPLYESSRALTQGPFEVYAVDLPEHRKWMIVTATKEEASCLDVYRVDLESGEMTRLSTQTGQYGAVAVSPEATHVLATHSAYGRLPELTLTDVAAGTQVDLTDSHPEVASKVTQLTPEFFTYENRHGHRIHGNLFKPDGWTAEDKRPLLIYVYGGPLGTRKQVTQGSYARDGYLFASYMADKHGYVTCTIDPRGMSGYGAVFEKANFEQVGKPQVEDLVDGAKHLAEHFGVDAERVGIHGWSFGGFQTQMCLYTEPDVFACGIAGAGPTEWENYNAWYSTGTIGDTAVGKPELEKFSLLPLAKHLKAKLLLVHGMEDSNVLYQDTVRVYMELLEAGKETLVELFLDPTGGHGLGGHVKNLNRFRKYEEFLLRTLGSGEVEAEPRP